jgi:hypothetical protein
MKERPCWVEFGEVQGYVFIKLGHFLAQVEGRDLDGGRVCL